jgi:hypothetical protein
MPILNIIFHGVPYVKAIDLIGGIYFKQDENEDYGRIFDADGGILPISWYKYALCRMVSMREI